LAASARHLELVATDGELVRPPRTRGECGAVARPCPHSGCRYNLSADTLKSGAQQVHWLPEEQPGRPSCALDVAEAGGIGPTDVAAIMGVTKQRIDQIEATAVRKILRNVRAFRDYR
jgi:hypothetical protein